MYSNALAGPLAAPPAFAAVVHANRAAVHQAKGELLEAIADCLRAQALQPSYTRVRNALLAMNLPVHSTALHSRCRLVHKLIQCV